MKKFALTLIILMITITLFGCSNNSSKAISSFNSQLDNVESVVSSTNSSEISDVSPAIIYNYNADNNVQNHKATAFNNMNREENIRQQILSLNAFLKTNNLSQLKLNKNETSAIKTLTSNLKKYTSQLKNTKSEVKTIVSSIKKSSKNSKDTSETECNYTSLNNCLNERYIYLLNIYNNLNMAYEMFYEDLENNFDYTSIATQPTKSSSQSTKIKNSSSKEETKGLKKNIDSYNTYNQENKNNQNNYYNNQRYNYNNAYNYPPYGRYGYNYGYNNPGLYGYGYNNAYGYNGFGLGPNQFNPSRNTDTFYALDRNIDTYRFSPNMYGMNRPYQNGYYPAINIEDNLQGNNNINESNNSEQSLEDDKTQQKDETTAIKEENIHSISKNIESKKDSIGKETNLNQIVDKNNDYCQQEDKRCC